MLNLPLCHWSSQLFDLRAPSSTDVPVLLLNQPIVSRVTRILQLIKKRALIFVSYVIKEFAHAFSCAYIESWMHLGSLESTQEARVALDCASIYSLRIRALQTSPVHP